MDDEVELMAANPKLANIRFPDDRESIVSITDLAPCPSKTTNIPESTTYHDEIADDEQPSTTSDSSPLHNCQRHKSISSDTVDNSLPTVVTSPGNSTRPNSFDTLHSQPFILRRSSRNTHLSPNRFGNNMYMMLNNREINIQEARMT